MISVPHNSDHHGERRHLSPECCNGLARIPLHSRFSPGPVVVGFSMTQKPEG